jgi:hypothetical protein
MGGAHAHALRRDTPLAQRYEFLPDEGNELTIGIPPKDADAPFRAGPHDDLDAVRGILLSCLIGACLWVAIAIFAVRVL